MSNVSDKHQIFMFCVKFPKAAYNVYLTTWNYKDRVTASCWKEKTINRRSRKHPKGYNAVTAAKLFI